MNNQDQNDFVNAFQQPVPRPRGLPPTHPAGGRLVSDVPLQDEQESHNLFTMPKRKLRVRYKRFNINEPLQVAELDDIMTKCITTGSGYIVAREEWSLDGEGNRIVDLKYVEPEA